MGMDYRGGSPLGQSIQTGEVDDNAITEAKLMDHSTATYFFVEPGTHGYTVGAGSWTLNVDNALFHTRTTLQQSGGPAVNDNITFDVALPAGTYSMTLMHTTASSHGQSEVKVAGTQVMTVEHYSAVAAYNVKTTGTGINITTGGVKTITLNVTGKHGSSTDYYVVFYSLKIWRTGDST